MSFRNIIILAILSVVLVSAIAGETYFYVLSEKQRSSADNVIKSLQSMVSPKRSVDALAEARSNLEAQVERLKEMQSGFPSSSSLNASIKKDVSTAALAMSRADSLVSSLKLDPIKNANIMALGQKANQALSYMQLLAGTSASTVALNDAAQNAIELVKAYADALNAYVEVMTPSNSGLSASDISTKKSEADTIVSQANAAEESLNQTDSIPVEKALAEDSSNSGQATGGEQAESSSQSSGSGNQAGTSGGSQTETAGNGQPAAPNSSNQTSSTSGNNQGSGGSETLADIVNQENAVEKASDQVDQLGAGSAGEQPSSSSSTPSDQDSGAQNSADNGAYSGDGDNSGGIQVQTGTVKLIQGENDF